MRIPLGAQLRGSRQETERRKMSQRCLFTFRIRQRLLFTYFHRLLPGPSSRRGGTPPSYALGSKSKPRCGVTLPEPKPGVDGESITWTKLAGDSLGFGFGVEIFLPKAQAEFGMGRPD